MTDLAGRGPLGQKKSKAPPDLLYMEMVKQLPCAICGTPPPSDAHHCCCGRFSFRRAPDRDTIPLCKKHHQYGPEAIHEGKESWVNKHGPDTGYIEAIRKAVAAMKKQRGWL